MDSRFRFSKTRIEALPPAPKGKRQDYYCTHTQGLGLRVTSTGRKTFCVLRRVSGGKLERITLGKFPDLPLEEAQKKARAVIADLAQGESVASKRRTKAAQEVTLSEVFADYLESRKDLKPLTRNDMERALKEVLPDWRDKPVAKITPAMVEKRHAEYGKRSKARSNLAMRYLRALLNYAAAKYTDDEGQPIITSNPVSRLTSTKAWFRVDRRQTIIKAHQLAPWLKALNALARPELRDYLVFVLLTGLRREEALGLTWERVDLEDRTITIVDPKNHHDHTLPLSDYLLEILAQRKEYAVSELVFSDQRGRKISNFRYIQAAIEKQAGIKVTIHDLRRTFATVAESLDIPAYALKKLLNHSTKSDVTAGYIVVDVERLRAPMQKITDYMLKAGGMKESAQVVELVANEISR